MRVLLVEDDDMIGAALRSGLRDAAYATDWVRDGATALDVLATESYDLVLLDLGLPKRDGLTVLRQLRQRQVSVPVLIITARDDVDDRVLGLDAGADDYLVKPFELKELKARMRALSRRPPEAATLGLRSARLTLDPATQLATVDGGPPVALTRREFALLQALMLRPGTIVSRQQLEDRVYGWGEEVESNAIEFLLHALRKKLGSDSILNVRGAGWMVSKQP